MSILALIAGAVMCAFCLYYGARGETFMGRPLGGDFVQFYAVGKIINEQPAARIYDIPFLAQVEHQTVAAMPKTQMLIFGNAPYIALLFAPFARLPYFWAYCAWLGFSALVFAGALWFMLRGRFPDAENRMAFLLALSAPMYVFETWIGGQLSVIAFAMIVAFIRCLESQRTFLAGLAIGCLVYKPSLIALPVAVMVMTTSWRMLAGWLSGAVAMGFLCITTMGVASIRSWLQVLHVNGVLTNTQEAAVRWSKNLDFQSFFTVLLGAGLAARVLSALVLAASFAGLAWLCWRSRRQRDQRILWALVLLVAPLINIYFPVYDSVIVIPAVILLASSLTGDDDRRALQGWLTLLWLTLWLTQAAADFARVQIFTVALAAFAWWVGKRAVYEARQPL